MAWKFSTAVTKPLFPLAIAEYCAQNLFQKYDSIPRKVDVTMPSPEICQDGVTLQVGHFKFRPTHKLSQLGVTPNHHFAATASSVEKTTPTPQSTL